MILRPGWCTGDGVGTVQDAVESVPGKKNSLTGLPDNYLLLKRASHVRVTHILVYQQPAARPFKLFGADWTVLLILLYAVGLLCLGGQLQPYTAVLKRWLFSNWWGGM